MSFVTNPAQFGPPPKPKVVPVGPIPDLVDQNGKPAKLFARRLLVWQFAEYQDSIKDERGQSTLKSQRYHNAKYVAAVICDKDGNPIWPSPDDAVEFFRLYPQATLDALFVAAAQANEVTEDAVARAEKNSEETPSDS